MIDASVFSVRDRRHKEIAHGRKCSPAVIAGSLPSRSVLRRPARGRQAAWAVQLPAVADISKGAGAPFTLLRFPTPEWLTSCAEGR